MKEANIKISGKKLTTAQSMTLRVALQNFAMFLTVDGLGNDAHAKTMCAGYLRAISEMNILIAKTAK